MTLITYYTMHRPHQAQHQLSKHSHPPGKEEVTSLPLLAIS